jgi:LysM repeat protein
MFALSAIALIAAGMLTSQSAGASFEPSNAREAFNYVSVMPGDTLWELAQNYSDGMNQQDWIAEVIKLNNLSSATLVAGEKLALP